MARSPRATRRPHPGPRPKSSRGSDCETKPEPPLLTLVSTPAVVPEPDLRPKGVATAVGAAQGDPDKAALGTDVVAKEVVSLTVDGAEKDVEIAVVVEIGKDRTAAVAHRVGARDPRDVEVAAVAHD